MSSTGNIATGTLKDGSARTPFLAFTSDTESLVILKQFAQTHGLAENVIHQGDIDSACEFLKTNASPQVLCVDIMSVESAPAALDKLADVCDPGIKVIVSGTINEYSFYCWLVEVGISNYLLKPFTAAALEAAYRKAHEVTGAAGAGASTPEVKKSAKIISVLGSRGGTGATTVSVNLAWLLAHELKQKTALLDFDPQLGTVALALDLEPGRGLRDALEKPERIDGLFMDRVMVKLDDTLSILSTEEAFEEFITVSEAASEALFTQTRPKFSHIVVDLPRELSPYTRYAIRHSDHLICVTEYTITGLRESLRYLEYCRDVLKIPPPIFVANRVGLAGKHQMPQGEFEKGLGVKVAYQIPFLLDVFAAATTGQVLGEATKNSPATKALRNLAAHFVEADPAKSSRTKKKGLSSLFKGGK